LTTDPLSDYPRMFPRMSSRIGFRIPPRIVSYCPRPEQRGRRERVQYCKAPFVCRAYGSRCWLCLLLQPPTHACMHLLISRPSLPRSHHHTQVYMVHCHSSSRSLSLSSLPPSSLSLSLSLFSLVVQASGSRTQSETQSEEGSEGTSVGTSVGTSEGNPREGPSSTISM
jgi:hypothetical protein